jgi:carboxypeptidase PM20D1
MRSRQLAVEPVELAAIDKDGVVERFSQSLRFRTVSVEDEAAWDPAPFLEFNRFVAEKFPLVHARLKRETVSDYSLLYTWEGRSTAGKPILLMSHIDVVPVVPGTEKLWEQPPYSGNIADGYVWGRGSLDDKLGVMGLLEAVEWLLARNFQPERTIYLAFGHDEELGGPHGAQRTAALLQSRGVTLEFVLDEGGAIIKEVVPGIDDLVAAVGIAEKGSVTVELTARSPGGHSSSPPMHTTIGQIATAIHKLEQNQMPNELRTATLAFFEYTGPEMSLFYKTIFANLWLFGGIVEASLASGPATAATVRTTTAATVIGGGVKSNVLPTDARALVNFRILPGNTAEQVVAHVKTVIDNPDIEVRVLPDSREASEVSPTDSQAFVQLQKTIRQVFPGTVVAPYLTLGGTDSRYFVGLTPNIYKFAPIIGVRSDLTRMHGTNERLGIENYVQTVQFFVQLIRNTAAASG